MAIHGRRAAAAVSALLALAACSEDRTEGTRPAEGGAPGLHADFTARGAVISPAGGAGWAFQATPWGLGCDGSLVPLEEAEPEIRADRTVYARPGLDEWYVRSPRGMEQGFTLPAPPPCRREGKAGVVIALGAGLPAVVDDGGREARLHDAAGREVLRYADLHVVDAAGRELPSSLAVRGEGLAIRFDDTGAAYPVVVDPIMWADQQDLTPPDPDKGADDFGIAVALSGDTALVGSPGHGPPGSTYVFVRSGTTWSFEQELGGSGAPPGAGFGRSVAMSADTAIIGAPGTSGVDGTAYVFVRSGGTWAQQQRLADTGSVKAISLGFAVALSGDTALVGAPGEQNTPGAAFVFVRSGTKWTLQQAFSEGALLDGGTGDLFGVAVAVSGDAAIIGAPAHGAPGSAYVFVRSGTTWSLQQTLAASDASADDGFGMSVALEGDTAVVGSQVDGAYMFTRSGTTWTPAQKLFVQPESMGSGIKVALSGGNVLVGTSPGVGAGSVYAYTPSGGSLGLAAIMNPHFGAQDFCDAIAADGNTVIGGAPSGRPQAAPVFAWGVADGDACTSGAECFSGSCVDGVCCTTSSCPAASPCNTAEHCQPGTGQCTHTPIHEGMACDDHDACTHPDTCQDGTCTGPPTVCTPADDCHEFGACDSSSGQCSMPAKPDGAPCAGGKTCVTGVCGGPQGPSPGAGSKGCACDAAGGAPAGGALVSWIALAILRRRRLRAR